MDTRVAVVVVPIFAPMMMGMASSMERVPDATSPTTIVVVVEELWMMPVATNPRMSPATGSDTVLMSCSANPLPAILKAVLINSILEKKRKRRKRKYTTRRKVGSQEPASLERVRPRFLFKGFVPVESNPKRTGISYMFVMFWKLPGTPSTLAGFHERP
jgi:hypothetical protein